MVCVFFKGNTKSKASNIPQETFHIGLDRYNTHTCVQFDYSLNGIVIKSAGFWPSSGKIISAPSSTVFTQNRSGKKQTEFHPYPHKHIHKSSLRQPQNVVFYENLMGQISTFGKQMPQAQLKEQSLFYQELNYLRKGRIQCPKLQQISHLFFRNIIMETLQKFSSHFNSWSKLIISRILYR